jgi:diadenylate cyclase
VRCAAALRRDRPVIEAIYEWLSALASQLADNYHPLWDSLDIALVALGVYWLLLLIKGTRAEQMTLGLLLLVLAWLVSQQAQLATLGFILDNFLSWGVLIVIVIFQADIRRGLTRVGRGVFASQARHQVQSIEETVRACQALAQRRVGALLVLQREIDLEEFMELGVELDASLSRDLLISIFLPYSPLHDGAVVLRENRVAAAGCILPLALRTGLPSSLGTRHRAALGISEESDAVAVVVSEESGRISVFCEGEMHSDVAGPELRQLLLRFTGLLREVDEAPVEEERVVPSEGVAGLAPGPEVR